MQKSVYLVNGAPERPLDETAKQALEAVDFLVVQDIFESDVAQLADVVLQGSPLRRKMAVSPTQRAGCNGYIGRSIPPARRVLIGKLSNN